MKLKQSIVTGILALILTAAAFVAGMNYTMKHMEIETDGDGDTAFIYMNNQVYIHGINEYPIGIDEPLTACYQID